jgi:uncharacterized phage-associated protein
MDRMNRLVGFRSRKAAQAAAYFIGLNKSKIDKLKLIKLMYLSERESIDKRGRPMVFDEFYSMKDGPICSDTLNGLNGQLDKSIWRLYIINVDNKTIKLSDNIRHEDLKEMSKSDFDIMSVVWKKFGHMTSSQIRAWTHENCHEYKLVIRGRFPISYRDIYSALGHDDLDQIEETVKEHRSLEAALECRSLT